MKKNKKTCIKVLTQRKNYDILYLRKRKKGGAYILFNQNLLKAKIIEKGLSPILLCNSLGICEATFYRKLARNWDFSRFEINKISEELNLTCKERDDIFFAQ